VKNFNLTQKQASVIAHLLEFALIHPDERAKFDAVAVRQLERRGLIETGEDGISELSQLYYNHLRSLERVIVDFGRGSFPIKQWLDEQAW